MRQKLASKKNSDYPLGIPKDVESVELWLQDLSREDHADIFVAIYDLLKRKDKEYEDSIIEIYIRKENQKDKDKYTISTQDSVYYLKNLIY